jgi:TIR domain-containing protein/centrosomal CEP192-like protein
VDGIFISYRRDDTAGYAGRLYDRLAGHFGTGRVFMDVEGIEPGTDFVTAIEQAVGSCRVLIVLMGQEWLGATDAAGRRRLDDPNDFIRLETCAALQRNIRVIPVLVEGASMPQAADLPEEIRPLTRRQAVEISHKQWEASTGELIRTLEPLLQAAPASPPPARPTDKPAKPADPSPEPKLQTIPEHADPGPRPWPKWIPAAGAILLAGGAYLAWTSRQPETPPPPPTPVAETPPPAPARVTADSSGLAFGTHAVGATAQLTLRLTNPGQTAAALGPRFLSGAEAGQFAIVADNCAQALPPAAECQLTVAFTPTAPGPRQASLDVALAPGTEPLSIALSGGGAAPPAATPAQPAQPAQPPVIRAFNSRVEGTRAILCYRVDQATSVSLAPRPGTLARADRACVTLPLREPTTFTLSAQGPGGSTTSEPLAVEPEAAPVARPPPTAPHPEDDLARPIPATAGQARVGEIWTYQTRGMWPTSPKRRLQFVVRAVDGSNVTEELRQLQPEGRGTEQKRSRGGEAGFLGWTEAGSEFSPYLGTRLKWTGDESWSNIATPDFDSNWRNWHSSAKMVGQEKVQVPAGNFRTWKVEVWSSRAATGSRTQAELEPVRIRYLVWYAPQLARYVRMERKILSAGSTTMEEDIFELSAHRPGP